MRQRRDGRVAALRQSPQGCVENCFATSLFCASHVSTAFCAPVSNRTGARLCSPVVSRGCAAVRSFSPELEQTRSGGKEQNGQVVWGVRGLLPGETLTYEGGVNFLEVEKNDER